MPCCACGWVVAEVAVSLVGALGCDRECVGDVTPGGTGGDGFRDFGLAGLFDPGGVCGEFCYPGEVTFDAAGHLSTVVDGHRPVNVG